MFNKNKQSQRGFLEGIELLFHPAGWIIIIVVVVVLGIWQCATTKQVVYKKELLRPGCKDYIALPMIECKDGTELKIVKCKCITHWVKVDGVEAQKVLDGKIKSSDYRIERE